MLSRKSFAGLLAFNAIVSVGAIGECGAVESAISAYQSAMKCPDRQQRLNGFHRSELLFQKAIDEVDGPVNASLYTNLGNACLSGERLGSAIVAYRRALLINPRDNRARNNLEYARSLLPEWAKHNDESSVLDLLPQSIRDTGNLATVAAACFVIACLLFVAALRWQVNALKLLSAVPFLAWAGLLAASFALSLPASLEAVVVRDDVTAHSADSHHSSARFEQTVPNGTEVVVLRDRDDWLQVSISGETAWVPKSVVEMVSLGPGL
jgi:tetratricopeptide (TPR) repeat protein